MTVEVLLAAVDPLGVGLPERFWQALTAEERSRADRYRRACDRAQFVAARGLLHAGLRRFFGVKEARIHAEPGRKPVLAGAGAVPGLDFNLSHTEGIAVCAIGAGVAVGVDVEGLGGSADAVMAAAAQFAPAERRTATDPAGVMRLWTLKEAVSKAVGLGLALPFQDFVCQANPPRLAETCSALGALGGWRLESWTEAAHVVSVAMQGRSLNPSLQHRFDMRDAAAWFC